MELLLQKSKIAIEELKHYGYSLGPD
jgi:hypothetical protein